mgnify:FL=1
MWNEDNEQGFRNRAASQPGLSVSLSQVQVKPVAVKRRPEELTPREREILQMVWAGMTNRVIAERLQISIKTAEAHRANMMKKLRVSNIAQLLKTALEEGLLATHAS